MNHRDFYQVLGVARDASPAEIRAAFVRLAKRHHPDHARPADARSPDARPADVPPDHARSAGGLPGRLHEVQQAYRCLSNATARAAHDRLLDDIDRLHVTRQRTVQRRLRNYDGRHPQLRPRPQPLLKLQPGPQPAPPADYRCIRWRSLLIVTASVVVVVRALTLVG